MPQILDVRPHLADLFRLLQCGARRMNERGDRGGVAAGERLLQLLQLLLQLLHLLHRRRALAVFALVRPESLLQLGDGIRLLLDELVVGRQNLLVLRVPRQLGLHLADTLRLLLLQRVHLGAHSLDEVVLVLHPLEVDPSHLAVQLALLAPQPLDLRAQLGLLLRRRLLCRRDLRLQRQLLPQLRARSLHRGCALLLEVQQLPLQA
mmetsp:Transcript_35189/g.91412  ORF Transcript_35189/g.91412 Transcript_35189/m.91412 type:complete len:206 (+) Transcript_35189:1239-1856(+)